MTSYYNNWLYFYIIVSANHQTKTINDKEQMKSHEKLYTVTIQTGKIAKIKNGIIQ